MPRVKVPFWGVTAEQQSKTASTDRCVNLFLEACPEGAPYPFVLLPTPGLTQFAEVGSGPIRGMIAMGGLLWVVSGDRLYSVTRDAVIADIGEIAGSGRVYLCENGVHIGIGTNSTCYAANASGITSLPESNFCGAAYFDGYGIFAQAGTEKFWISGIDDMTTISGLDFSSADTFADYLKGCVNLNRDLLLVGEKSTEGWYNSGDARFPFSRAQGAFIELGCNSSATIAKISGRAVWLGDDLNVWAVQGYQPQIISPPWVAKIIRSDDKLSSANAFTYSSGGHSFYVLCLGSRTLVFDFSTGLWHERATKGLDIWRASCCVFTWEKNIVGDYSSGYLYEMSESVYTDNGDEIVRTAQSSQVRSSGNRVSAGSLVVEADVGIGLDGASFSTDPVIYLSWSDDDGRTWSNELESKIGEIGEYGTTIRWNRLGAFRRRSFRLRTSERIPIGIVSAFVDLEGRL